MAQPAPGPSHLGEVAAFSQHCVIVIGFCAIVANMPAPAPWEMRADMPVLRGE